MLKQTLHDLHAALTHDACFDTSRTFRACTRVHDTGWSCSGHIRSRHLFVLASQMSVVDLQLKGLIYSAAVPPPMLHQTASLLTTEAAFDLPACSSMVAQPQQDHKHARLHSVSMV